MIVVFDANVWYSQLGLKSPSAAAIRFFLRQRGAKVAIPEVVRLEVTRNLTTRLRQHIETIRAEHRQLLTAFGKLREIVLPTDNDVQTRIEELLASLGVETIEIAFSLESARSSFLKTIEKQPPSKSTQQFKDGVLWADCLSLLRIDDVVLVTDDRAFYEDQTPSKGLARNLLEEAESCPHTIRVLSTLPELLDAVREPISMDADSLEKVFFARFGDRIFGILERSGFELRSRTRVRLTPFATDNPAILFVEFEMSFDCEDVSGQGRAESFLQLKGDCSFDTRTVAYTDIRNFGEHLSFREIDGTLTERRNHVLYADPAVIGHRVITDTTRFRLDDP
jgi:hypothetical protein